jgi:hypothetical protein
MLVVPSTALNGRYLLLSLFAFLTLYIFYATTQWRKPYHPALKPPKYVPSIHAIGVKAGWFDDDRISTKELGTTKKPRPHVIDKFLAEAEKEWEAVMKKRSEKVEDAAKRYRERRGRHPPPGFEKWFALANVLHADVVEEFFDQIYVDLAPFWGVKAERIRAAAKGTEYIIQIREGKAQVKDDRRESEWIRIWEEMIASVSEDLPDLDIPINVMDESRVVVPWEEIGKYMRSERNSRGLPAAQRVTGNWTALEETVDTDQSEGLRSEKVVFNTKDPYWELAKVGCPPRSAFRDSSFSDDFSGPPPAPETPILPESDATKLKISYLSHNYIRNWTASKDICTQPDIQGSHGAFIEPISKSTTHTLVPLFGTAKFSVNNDILLPSPLQWRDDFRCNEGGACGRDWREKKNKLYWRDTASSGRNREATWTRFQRHRFVSMLNSTAVSLAIKNSNHGLNFDLDAMNLTAIPSLIHQPLPQWLPTIADASFSDLSCFPPTNEPNSTYCSYTSPYFAVDNPDLPNLLYNFKYLPSLDGNPPTGSYPFPALLLSTSLPLKSSIVKEWHDARLQPWLHFIPLSTSYTELYSILDYLIGNTNCGDVAEERDAGDLAECIQGHEEAAEKLARVGREWAERALRREDMRIYLLRLLLEYARVSDPERDRLGYVRDLVKTKAKNE